jgi:hypothetical protein
MYIINKNTGLIKSYTEKGLVNWSELARSSN